jgi:hypothetical protein
MIMQDALIVGRVFLDRDPFRAIILYQKVHSVSSFPARSPRADRRKRVSLELIKRRRRGPFVRSRH